MGKSGEIKTGVCLEGKFTFQRTHRISTIMFLQDPTKQKQEGIVASYHFSFSYTVNSIV